VATGAVEPIQGHDDARADMLMLATGVCPVASHTPAAATTMAATTAWVHRLRSAAARRRIPA